MKEINMLSFFSAAIVIGYQITFLAVIWERIAYAQKKDLSYV